MADSVGRVTQAMSTPDILADLGVRPIINGAGTYTMFCGAVMHPDVTRAIGTMAPYYVRINELHDAVARRIASMLQCEAALVTSGAFGALTLGTAACITGADPAKIRQLPDTTGMKSEVVIQKQHRFPYDHAVRNCGVRLVEVESRGDLERAISERTAMLLFLNKAEPKGQISAAEFVEAGKRHSIPTLNDAAADVPPVDNLFKYTRLGFDLVAFSGGKGLRGPQNAGLLLGRADLIATARLSTAPNSDSLGRGLKVSKEDMVGMMVALETYLKRDHDADWREWERVVQVIRDHLAGLDGVQTERFIPLIANQVPHVRVRWDNGVIPMASAEVAARLRKGDPSIEVVPTPYEAGTLEVSSWTLQPGEAEVVARRIGEILTGRG